MVAEDDAASPHRTVVDIFRHLQAHEGYLGSYSAIWRRVSLIRSAELRLDISVSPSKIEIRTVEVKRHPSVYRLVDGSDRPRPAERTVSVTMRTDHRADRRQAAFDWMHACAFGITDLDEMLPADHPDRQAIAARLRRGSVRERTKALAVLAGAHEIAVPTIAAFLGASRSTIRKYARLWQAGGAPALFDHPRRANSKADNPAIQQAIFAMLHEPPALHEVNRTSWTLSDLSRVLAGKGHRVGIQVISKVVRSAGYRWRKARVVLTSNDPDYATKLAAVQGILSRLTPEEAFFSIDEFGPFAVKMKQGSKLEAPGTKRIVPQWQKSKGRLIMTAALELSGNQVTHFYSAKKDTQEIIRMLAVLLERYADRRKLYLSWDAASWHVSKKLMERIAAVNAAASVDGGPFVEAAPLPAGAQFLNVIESVFSGMARAIIHNSDYASADAAKAAIDRHFADRNEHFRLHPKRAGRKIWGQEREPAAFSTANNCKDPLYR